MFKRVDHIEIAPGDFGRTMAFYQEVLGFTFIDRFPVKAPPLKEVAYLRLGDTMIELLSYDHPASASTNPRQVGYRAIALEVTNMEQTITYLEGKGIKIAWGPVNLGDSVRAEIRDPDGLTIELRQWSRG